MQLRWTFGGEGWVKMWSKSDSEEEKKKKREIDKVLSGSLGTQRVLPEGWGKRGGGCGVGLGCLEVFWSSWEWQSLGGMGEEQHKRDQLVWVMLQEMNSALNEKQSSQSEQVSPRGHFPGCTQPTPLRASSISVIPALPGRALLQQHLQTLPRSRRAAIRPRAREPQHCFLRLSLSPLLPSHCHKGFLGTRGGPSHLGWALHICLLPAPAVPGDL